MTFKDNTSNLCNKCGKPYTYVGDALNYPKGQEPWCTCCEFNSVENNWKYCPHCGKELR